jgi:hypothetical protein
MTKIATIPSIMSFLRQFQGTDAAEDSGVHYFSPRTTALKIDGKMDRDQLAQLAADGVYAS